MPNSKYGEMKVDDSGGRSFMNSLWLAALEFYKQTQMA